MKKSRFTDEQITFAPWQAESGMPLVAHGVLDADVAHRRLKRPPEIDLQVAYSEFCGATDQNALAQSEKRQGNYDDDD